jgi:rRNA 2'-O-methyltransferase fibrillarin
MISNRQKSNSKSNKNFGRRKNVLKKNNFSRNKSFRNEKPSIIINAHPRVRGVFLSRNNKNENLVTLSLVPGKSVYNEKRIIYEEPKSVIKKKKEFRIWNPYRSKLGASIINGIKDIFIKPGSKVLYLGAASGTTVSHIADIVGFKGSVYAVEFAAQCVRQMIRMAQDRTNVIPIFADARLPNSYRLMVPMVFLYTYKYL